MRLQSIKYAEYEGRAQEWVLEGVTLGSKNLIVGKNASGKSRILNVIGALSSYLAGVKQPWGSSRFDSQLQHEDKTYQYLLHLENEQVISEKLLINDIVYLDRGEGGVGTIKAEEIGNDIRFQTPPSELAAVVRRDAIQHSFLEPLYDWASSLRHYHFGSSLGKDKIVVFQPGGNKADERDENAVVAIFRDGKRDYPDEFVKAIINDMASIDYHVETIDIAAPLSVRIVGLPGEPVGLYVKEKDLSGITDQFSMSQGMFRVLSLLIHVNYFQLRKTAACVLVDDIGEGLDFDRSCRLIELLRSKATQSDIQIILSSNDRFIMNKVPLEEWSVLQRKGSHVNVRNYSNSHKVFDEFRYTGLSNFSFLEMDVINEQPAEDGH